MFSKFKIIHMDEFVDSLLREEILFGITLPHLPKRYLMEEQGLLAQYHSPLEEEYFEMYGKSDSEEEPDQQPDGELPDAELPDAEEQPSSKLKQRREKKSSSSDESDDNNKTKSGAKNADSIEYWNEIRAKQGLRPLKPTESAQSESKDKSDKHKRKRKHSSDSDKADKKNGKTKEDTIEYWNEMRTKLGLRPLKPKEEE
uniref:Pre-mRNA-splicing factor 38 n=1 Tax=Euplotes harpa TaxID=151035 RepID=A0A7S3J5S5_9SPIT|mmetsp:Transcript_18507/g.21261  ORF Transcript_18507/g.21261 Transcript_18507/m.21261 type:complete len:200 (+) Transcript_18507:432-1031(+)